MKKQEIATRVVGSALLAMLMEISIHPKPLNVTRFKNIGNLRFENFLATISHLALPFHYAFRDGYKGEFKIGRRILQSTEIMMKSQSAGNTNLGSILLLVPLITASSYALKRGELSLEGLKESIRTVLEKSKAIDSVLICEAILLTNPKWLIKIESDFDITKEGWRERILRKDAKPKEIMAIASNFDWIAYEYVNDFKITLEENYPYLRSCLEKEDLQQSVTRTFLWILSRRKDSHIARKYGEEEAEKLREFVEKRMDKRDIYEIAEEIEREFAKKGFKAGTTADLIVACLFLLFLLEGSRKYI